MSVAEHHSNLVPWQLACQRTGARLRHVPLTADTQELDMQARGPAGPLATARPRYFCLLRGTAWHGALSARCAQALTQMLSPKTKIVALVAVSNMLGSILDTAYVAEQAHRVRPWASEGVSPCASCAPSCAVWPGEVALWHCPSAGRGESVRSACQMRLEVHAVRRAPGGRWAPGCCWTAARRCRTCRWTCGAWARTGSWPPRTRCAGRPASASCGAGPRGAGSCAAAAPLACCQAGACKSGIASLL